MLGPPCGWGTPRPSWMGRMESVSTRLSAITKVPVCVCVYVYVCVYVCICMYVCMYICMYACTYESYEYVCICLCMYECVCINKDNELKFNGGSNYGFCSNSDECLCVDPKGVL